MKTKRTARIAVLILAGALFASAQSQGGADPAWLKSWNEAQETRPVTLMSRGIIAAKKEAGIPLVIQGQVVGPDGAFASGVVVHAYHRDHEGFEFGPNDNSVTTWALQGWAQTDAQGRFEFQTIRPAPDHLGREAAHIHFTLESDTFGRQWAPKIFFSDDPHVTAGQRQRSKEAGEFGWVREVRVADGVAHVDVRIRLKEHADF